MSVFNPIFVRSPRIVSQSGVAGDNIVVELRMWKANAVKPTNPTYTLSKVIPSAIATTAYFDISPYCREFIKHISFTQTTTLTAVNVDEYTRVEVIIKKNTVTQSTTTYTAFDGYGYYEQEYNPDLGDVMLDEGEYYYEEASNAGAIYIFQDGTYTQAVYNGTETIIIANSTNDFASVPAVHPDFVNTGNTVLIFKLGNPFKTYTFTPQCESKYTPIKCDFVNRYGVWQQITFFKSSVQNFEKTNNEFHLMPGSINYNKLENRRQEFNINGRESVRVNTGFVPESYKYVMQQLMLSEKIMLNNSPVNLVTKTIELQEHINKKLINYQLDFIDAFNKLNYIL